MKPKLTQTMKMHLNGGRKFSSMTFAVLADGKGTGITRVKRTSGSPKFLITLDEFHAGDEVFDVMATKGVGMEEWLLAHIPKEQT